MPRRPRNHIPGYSYHVVQRGVNKATTFFDDDDRLLYLSLWQKYSKLHDLGVHAYCLMTNHVHFLVTPRAQQSISCAIQAIGSTYAGYINEKYVRTGSLWEGRYRSSLVDSDDYVLRCYRYIELNPVRAGMVTHPDAYRWSSHRFNTSPVKTWLTAHPSYLSLGNSTEDRQDLYRNICLNALSQTELAAIRRSLNSGVPLARPEIVAALEQRHSLRLRPSRPGRPRKTNRTK